MRGFWAEGRRDAHYLYRIPLKGVLRIEHVWWRASAEGRSRGTSGERLGHRRDSGDLAQGGLEGEGRRSEPPRCVHCLHVRHEKQEQGVVPSLGPERLKVRATISHDGQTWGEPALRWKGSPQLCPFEHPAVLIEHTSGNREKAVEELWCKDISLESSAERRL